MNKKLTKKQIEVIIELLKKGKPLPEECRWLKGCEIDLYRSSVCYKTGNSWQEALVNAIVHRDYCSKGKVQVRI